MDLLYTIAVTLLALFVLVAVHEYGHYWVARRCGVKVLRFSIGFGRSLLTRRDKHGTEFSLAAIPLGGYVKMLDEREGEVPPELLSQAFTQKTPLQRIAIVSAGPLANFLLAVLVYWGLFVAGESGYAPVIGKVESGSLADIAGLEVGQEVVSIDGSQTPTWQAVSFRLLERIGDTGTLQFSLKRAGSDVLYTSQVPINQWLSEQEQPDLLGGLGLTPEIAMLAPVLAEISPDSPAQRAGLRPGDRLVSADDQSMVDWMQWVKYVKARPEQAIELELIRDGVLISATVTPAKMISADGEPFGQVGVLPKAPDPDQYEVRRFDRGPVVALGAAVQRTGDMAVFTLNSIKKMLMGLISPKNLSGPITIAKVATASAKSGLESYVSFLALLSVSLGVLNLLPIPVLDGGHLLFYTVELLIGKPVPEKVQILGYQLGLFVVLGIMAFALYNDFTRL